MGIHRSAKLGLDGQFSVYQLTFSCWLHFLKHRKNARIWQNKSADDILRDVFNSHPQARARFRFDLHYPVFTRPYCTQYDSDWNFAMQLMESEGWFCYHQQEKNGKDHTLVITDTARLAPYLQPKTIAFYHAAINDDADTITHWRSARQLISSKLNTVTFDYEAPHYCKNPTRSIQPGHSYLPEPLEVYEYSGAYSYVSNEQGKQQARHTTERWESEAKRYFATSSVRHVEVGSCFELQGHTDQRDDRPAQREFLILGLYPSELKLPEYKPSLFPPPTKALEGRFWPRCFSLCGAYHTPRRALPAEKILRFLFRHLEFQWV